MQTELLNKIIADIDVIKTSEKITKDTLSVLSRDILTYIGLNGSNDIDTVNRLLAVLTPMNYVAAGSFFNHFLPFVFDKKTGTFGKKIKGTKTLAKYLEDVTDFLADEENDIWTWSNVNLEVAERKSFADRIGNVVTQALAGIDDKDNRDGLPAISAAEVLSAVMESGIKLEDLFVVIDAMPEDDKATRGIMPSGENDLPKGKESLGHDDEQSIAAHGYSASA